MQLRGFPLAALLAVGAFELVFAQQEGVLDPRARQEASSKTGQDGDIDPGQTESLTSNDNFINFCVQQSSLNGVLTNGQQKKGGSCSLFGDIPSAENMVSSIIVFPEAGSTIAADTTFDIKVKMVNFAPGAFTNPLETYYSAPQTLRNGVVDGHTHVSCQSLGANLNPTQAPAANRFDFFKGINTAEDADGFLTANVKGGLKAGNYRCCTMASARNHQPVLMPVAQRGPQDDCQKFTVSPGGATPPPTRGRRSRSSRSRSSTRARASASASASASARASASASASASATASATASVSASAAASATASASASQTSSAAGAAQTSDAAGAAQTSDAAGASQTSDAAGAAQTSDAAGAAQTSDAAGAAGNSTGPAAGANRRTRRANQPRATFQSRALIV